MRVLPGTTLRRRAITWVVLWAVTLVGLRLTLLAPEVCPAVTATSVHTAAVGAADWIVANQASDGSYLYDFDVDRDGPTGEPYNIVRHAGTTMSLYQFVLEGEDHYLPAADLGLQWLLDRRVGDGRVGDEEVIAFAESERANAKLGTAALAVVGLIHRRLATGDTRHDVLLQGLGRMILGQQRPDGSMLDQWSPTTGEPVPDRTSLFATGEALWALALLHGAWPDAGYDQAARTTLDYVATRRDEDEDVWPRPWADQWAAYSLHEMAGWGLDPVHVDYARRLAAQWGVAVRWESQRNGGIDGLVHAPESIAAGQGTWLEGLAMMRQLAAVDGRLADLEEPLGERLLCGAGRMIAKQTTGTERAELDGGFFVDGVTRVDGQQHVLSGLIFSERLLRDQTTEVGDT